MAIRVVARMMDVVRSVAGRLRGFSARSAFDRRIDDEMQLHVQLQADAFRRRGMTEAEARRAARIAFGAMQRFKDEARDETRIRLVEELRQDLSYALRGSRKAPLVTGVALATLAVAIGISTLAFGAVNAVMLRALPYPDPGRLVLVWGTSKSGELHSPVAFTNAEDWRRNVGAFATLAMFSCTTRPALTGAGEAVRLSGMDVSAEFFATLRVRAMLGRTFDSTDFVAADAPGVVLDNAVWRSRFASDRDVVGKRIALDGAARTVIGVLPPGFAGMPSSLGCRPDVYRPLQARYDNAQRSWSFLKAIVRLRDGVSIAQAQSELDAETTRLAADFPTADAGHAARVVSLTDEVVRPVGPALLIVQGGTLLVLLIACANIANLLLARATTRRREFATRIALGASRARLMRQVAVECVSLAAVGGGAGLLLAAAGVRLIERVGASVLPDIARITLDLRGAAFVAAATALAGILIAIGPVLTVGALAARQFRNRDSLAGALRDGGRRASGAQSRVRRALVSVQVALALVALIDAGLLAQSYRRLMSVPAGFDANEVLAAEVGLPDARYPRGEKQVAFFRLLTSALARAPRVIAAGAVSILPESPNFDQTIVRLDGHVYGAGEEPVVDVYRATPGYFESLRIPLRSGRGLSREDDGDHPPVAVINETMAARLFPGESPFGRRIWTGAGNAVRTIVGVVGDVYQYGLDSRRTMQLYVSHADNSGGHLTVVVRSAGDPAALASVLRTAVRALDADVPIDNIQTLSAVVEATASRRAFLARVSLALAIGALVLAAVGLYGVVAYATIQRTSEIGIRLALGASLARILVSVILEGLSMAAGGLAIGLLIARITSPFLGPLLFGATSFGSAATYLAAAVLLVMIALVSSALPAWRASRISPAAALRAE
jgi:putative ABC transport system permease protein